MKNKNENQNIESQSVNKVLKQLCKLSETKKFKYQIRRTREYLNIPVNGIIITDNDKDHLGDILHIPENVKHLQIEDLSNFTRSVDMFSDLIETQLAVRNELLHQVIKNFIFYDFLDIEIVNRQMTLTEMPALCKLEDRGSELGEHFLDFDKEIDANLAKEYIAKVRLDFENFPISICIHSDASQRDICSYIKKNWARIDRMQKLHSINQKRTVKHSKIRTNKTNRLIEKFVYDNRNLPLREISKKLFDELQVNRDQGEIGKIKSLAIKNRE